MSEPPVRTLGRYQLLEEIGRGGMGVVYRALDTTLHREVAIKILPPELVADPERKRRFLVEAQTASQLVHPHIGVIHEVGDADGMSFIAMELIRGEKLSEVLARQDLSAARAIELATEVAEGLSLAHDKGVVHRDLKPANVMVTEHGHAKIIDFGLAKLVRALSGDGATETVAATNPGVVMGTAAYMSPEQARAGKVDARSDIFSFGVMLYEMLAHRLPFRRQSDVDTLHALLHDPMPPLPPLGPAVTDDASADLQRILEKCLAKEPDARYQGARDIVVDLRAARRRLELGHDDGLDGVADGDGPLTPRRRPGLIIMDGNRGGRGDSCRVAGAAAVDARADRGSDRKTSSRGPVFSEQYGQHAAGLAADRAHRDDGDGSVAVAGCRDSRHRSSPRHPARLASAGRRGRVV